MHFGIIISLFTVLYGCHSSSADQNKPKEIIQTALYDFDTTWRSDFDLDRTRLLESVQAAIIPSYQDWVIFENGSYIIFDHIDSISDPMKTAKRWLAHYSKLGRPTKDWSVSITDLDYSEGWSVFGNGYGIYTFVHILELKEGAPPKQIGNYAKWKRAKDEQAGKIIYLHNSDGLQSFQ